MSAAVTLALLAIATPPSTPPSTPTPPFGEAAQACQASFPLTRKNLALTAALQSRAKAEGLGRLLSRKRLAVALVDLTPRDRIHYAAINGDEMMYAASLPKILALLGVVQGAKERRIKWTPAVATRMDRMINESSNREATWAVQAAGLDYLEALVRRPGYCFYGDRHGGLWVGRPYAKGGESNRDPLEHLAHAATARQVARFYTMLDKGLLVGPVGTARLRVAMGPPRKHHKFVGALEDRQGVVFLARKSGTWRQFHSDSALIEHGPVRYVLVALSDSPAGKAAMTKLARIADDLIVEGTHRSAEGQRR